jgi:hypothetical protein
LDDNSFGTNNRKPFKLNINTYDTSDSELIILQQTTTNRDIARETREESLNINKHGGAILSCPKCRRSKHVLCLAGGILLTQATQIPLYCMPCKLSFEAKKKKELKTGSQYLTFEVLAPDQKPLRPILTRSV